MTFGECEVSVFFFFFAVCVYKVINLNYLFVILICHHIFVKFSLRLHSEVVFVCFSNHY